MGSPSFWPSPKKPPLPPGGIDIAPPSPTPPKRCNPNIPVLSSFLCVFFSDSGDWWDIQLPWPLANANGLTGHFATSYLHNVHDTLFVFATSYFHNPSSHTHEKYSVLEGENMIKRGWGAWQLLQQQKTIEILLCSAERRSGYDWRWINRHQGRRRGTFPCNVSFVHASLNKDRCITLFVAIVLWIRNFACWDHHPSSNWF